MTDASHSTTTSQTDAAPSQKLSLLVEFADGLDTLMKSEKLEKKQGKTLAHIKFASKTNNKPSTIRDLIIYVRQEFVKTKPMLFCDGDDVRAGILVLINGADWEIANEDENKDKYDYELEDNDEIVFISTMHGG
ncbi:Ubiquitin- modifier 1 [Coemansia sp. RSA 552]|nr:Ubiquitin- modifier 1 [Coemansia sp. RSA 552]